MIHLPFLGQRRRVRGKAPNGNVDHTFLTSIVDQRGVLRVQHLGVREEFRRDLLSLLQE